jgi:hypothetical protein
MGDRLKPTLLQLEAMARLRGSPDAAKLIEAVREYELELTETLIGSSTEGQNRFLQGGIKALRAFRETFSSAPDTIRKLTSK